MNAHNAKSKMDVGAMLIGNAAEEMHGELKQHYKVECIRDGKVLWTEEFDNLVVTAGRNKYLDATLKTGSAAPLWFVGLVAGPTETDYVAADTMASHAGWSENTLNYSEPTRPAWTPGTVSGGSVDNAAMKAAFTIIAAVNVAISGAFMADNNVKGGATGTLLGVGALTAGDRLVNTGDTLNVTITCSLT